MDERWLYEEVTARTREAALLGSCAAILGWDEQTYMPTGGVSLRGEQAALLAGLQHDRATAPRIGEALDALKDATIAQGDSAEAANLRLIRRDYERRKALPKSLVEELARTTSTAQHEWVIARRNVDFERFRPWLDRILELKRQESACRRACLLGGHACPTSEQTSDAAATIYDPLLDDYEPGASTADLRVVFGEIREGLTPLVAAIAEARKRGVGSDGAQLRRSFPVDRQRMLAESAAAAVGFDFDRGRLDVTAHPFCTGIGPGDVRITTKYDERKFDDAFFSVLHEVGHGLYEQGLPDPAWGSPLGEAASLGVHESQSRLWENFVGRGRPFWNYWFPIARRTFHDSLHDASLDGFLAAVNRVEPSLIRIQADEVTYNLHIIIRFELELALVSGELNTVDLPVAWADKYAETLGVRPSNVAEGCLQDVHWSAGLFGYFPTYSLGNVYAAQLFAKATADLPGLEDELAKGDASTLLAWLRDKIHRHGRRYEPTELIERAVGGPIDAKPLLAHLQKRYGGLYGV